MFWDLKAFSSSQRLSVSIMVSPYRPDQKSVAFNEVLLFTSMDFRLSLKIWDKSR